MSNKCDTMQITGYEDMQIVKNLIKKLLKKYDSIKLNDILESYDAPTNTNEEILIELFPVNWINYKTETKINKQYISDCYSFADDLRRVLKNKIVTDISQDNNWAFIYIIF